MRHFHLPIRFLIPALTLAAVPLSWADEGFVVPRDIDDILVFHCYTCHDSGMKKGGVQLDELADLNQGERLDLMNLALEHVYSGEMPPKKEDRPTEEEKQALVNWIWSELETHDDVRLEDKLRYYKYANYIDHDKLFSGEITEKPFTRARRWRINELIYVERINDVFEPPSPSPHERGEQVGR